MELLGVRAAARELGVNASTVSRQIANGIIPNRGTEDEPKVDLAEARQARANLDPTRRSVDQDIALADAIDAEVADAATPARTTGENSAADRRSPVVTDPAYLAARIQRAKIATKMAELEYEKAAGLVISKADVEAAIFDATRLLRDDLLRTGEKLAVELAGMTDPAGIQKLINQEHRELLERLAAAFGKL